MTYKPRPHVEPNVICSNDRHVEERYMKPISENGHFKSRFKRRLIETRERSTGVSWFKMCCCQISESVLYLFHDVSVLYIYIPSIAIFCDITRNVEPFKILT